MRKRKEKQSDQPLKKKFIVGDHETLTQCLERMKREGYAPVRRTEKPIFRETSKGPACIGSQCILEGRRMP
ncbi:NETI motif-containing protein [Sporolactobacillus terrae]|uniref:NETI motif-containing protein n=1 Tax=Sporolactobacillus terrae TaxID=269673 RepID=UPI00055FE586|nr:NETI motif-containing protein [Sporolactobacillus terrae]